ncbi:glycosyltransferase [Thalassotalea hakodatensis]|uniref:glycosyltransferase n=1 Tax=Thalassotalea hakodatensis TaxID=3030492 RepID=UPI002573EE2D|nr:glycosyltransferase [Thalassotalea hakodatensis]
MLKVSAGFEVRVLILTNMFPTKTNPYWGIFVKEQIDSYKECFPNAQISVLQLINGGLLRRYLLSSYRLLKRCISAKPQFIHVHFGLSFLPLFFIMPYVRYKKIKIIVTFHGSDILGNNRLSLLVSKLALICADAVIGVSKQIFDRISNYNNNAHYLPCGVTSQFIHFVNRANDKRTDTIVFPSSPQRVEKNFPKFKRIIDRVECRIGKKLTIAIMESLSREEVANLFTNSVCLLMTSDYEGSPQVVKEAIFAGLPVVSTKVGDVPYLIENRNNCFISNNEQELAEFICLILSSQTKTVEEGKSTKQYELTNNHICQQLHKVYKHLLSA